MLDILKILRIASGARQGDVSLEDRQEALAIVEWQQETLTKAQEAGLPLKPSVQAMSDYFTCDNNNSESYNSIARMYATKMLEESQLEWFVFDNIEQWLCCINYVIQQAPDYNEQHFPMSKLFVFFMYSPSGAALFRIEEFNNLLTAVLNDWCVYLDSEDSKYVLTSEGWLGPDAQNELCLQQYKNYDNQGEPYWGFQSYNGFFHREIKLDEYRPLDGVGDDKAIVSANDGTVYRIARDVKECDEFWAKGQNYSLIDMFDGSPYADFIGGDVIQSFLAGSDYHRWHAPISGTVLEARVISALTFSELLSEGLDLSAGTLSQGYQAMVNTRGLIVIENPTIGKVAVLPVGITEISSITINVKKDDSVEKGQELGYFSYGGSTLVLVFQNGMIKEFAAQEPSDPNVSFAPCKTADSCKAEEGCLRVRAQIATAN